MVTKLYTRLLFEVPYATTDPYFSPTVPAGFVWVVTDVVVYTGGQPFQNAGGFALTTTSNGVIFARGNSECPANTYFHWTGRQEVGTGTYMRYSAALAGSALRVTGWELTGP